MVKKYGNRYQLYRRGGTYAAMGAMASRFVRKRKASTSAPLRRKKYKSGSRLRGSSKKKRSVGKVQKHSENYSSSYGRMGKALMYRAWVASARKLGLRERQTVEAKSYQNYNGSQGIAELLSFCNSNVLSQMSGDVSAATVSNKTFVGYGSTHISIKNQSSIVARAKLYELYCRRTNPLGRGAKEQWYKWNVDQGIDSLGVTGATLNGAHRVDATPYCSDVGYYYKIGKVSRLYLEPGQEFKRTISHKVHRFLRREVWENNTVEQIHTGGWTRTFLLVWNSGLVHDKELNPVDTIVLGASVLGHKEVANKITVSDVVLDVVVQHKVFYTIDATGTRGVVEAYPYLLNLADVNEEHMGDADDQQLGVNAGP